MPTKISILGWEAQGLRCPDHKISFLNGQYSYNISLIQMPNGTGKTTTLELLRAAISGEASNGGWDACKVKSLKKKNLTKPEGIFIVELLVNEKRLTIKMTFDFDEGRVSYTTTFGSGIKNGFDPPQECKRFLKSGFVNFFIFDGELAQHLLSSAFTDAQSAIEELFQLITFKSMKNHVNDYWKFVADSKSATEEKGFNRRKNRVDFLKKRIYQQKECQKSAQKDLEQAKQNLENKSQKFKKELENQGTLKHLISKAEDTVSENRRIMERHANIVFQKMRNPHALSKKWAQEIVDLKMSFDRVKLPESAAREFFEELAQESECICARLLDDSSRAAIRNRAERYLGSDDVSLLNSIKSDIANMIGDDPGSHEKELMDPLYCLENAISEYQQSITQYDLLRVDATETNPELKKVEDELIVFNKQIQELEQFLDQFDDNSDQLGDKSNGIVVLEKLLEKAKNELADITNTIEIKTKTDILSQILEAAHLNARNSISQQICNQANDRIASLMPDNQIRIEKIDSCLRLLNQGGGSTGEQLAVAYAFLATLFNRSDHRLPFVVDSPANPIDLDIRRRVAELIPKLTDQFIAFTISSERDAFLVPLEAASENQIQLLTLFRKVNPELEAKAKGLKDSVETDDGVLVNDRNFFCDFQLETENGGN